MEREELKKIISQADKLDGDTDMESIMNAYHRLEDLGEPFLAELIDDYILGRLDAKREKMLQGHLDSCDRCRKDFGAMRFFITGVKEIGDDML